MRRLQSSLFALPLIALVGAAVFAQQAAPPAPPEGGRGQGAAQEGGRGRGGRGGGGAGRAGGTPVGADGECPPNMTLVRPGNCGAPQFPAPTIVDYRPRTTLVTPARLVPKAKFPVIDSHNHTTITADNIDQMIKEMDENNLRVLVNLSGGSDPNAVKTKVDFIRASKYPDRFRVFANVQWTGAGGPGWAEKAVADLEQAVKNGAIGLKIAKGLGLNDRKADGSRLHVDDPVLKPVWDACARLNIPVIIHTADPQEFFSPFDMKNERWLELSLFNDRRHYLREDKLSFEDLMGERDRMYRANPRTRFIGAHFDWYGNNLARAAKQLEEVPNLVLEVGAVLYDFTRTPRASREFFIKYQDRILFGKDTFAVTEFPYYWRVFETNDEYFDYYRDYHAFWKLNGLYLPDEVLKKLYYKNAQRVTPGLPKTGFPN
jgi:predicted TIM-barrel fold metal-dependent hydrolase